MAGKWDCLCVLCSRSATKLLRFSMHGIESGGYNLRAPELEESKATIGLTGRHGGKVMAKIEA